MRTCMIARRPGYPDFIAHCSTGDKGVNVSTSAGTGSGPCTGSWQVGSSDQRVRSARCECVRACVRACACKCDMLECLAVVCVHVVCVCVCLNVSFVPACLSLPIPSHTHTHTYTLPFFALFCLFFSSRCTCRSRTPQAR